MEQLGKANVIRLRSHQGAYVVAHDDKATVGESDDGSSPNAKWLVERVQQGNPNVIRLKSCFGLYLTPSDGKLDWELICDDGVQVKLKSWGDKLLQADGAALSWTVSLMRSVGELLEGCCEPNSVSHHDPNTQNWVFWHVVVEDLPDEPVANNILVPPPGPVAFLLHRRNVKAPRGLHRGRRGYAWVSCARGEGGTGYADEEASDDDESNDFGQPNGGIGLDTKKASDDDQSNPFGQTNGSR